MLKIQILSSNLSLAVIASRYMSLTSISLSTPAVLPPCISIFSSLLALSSKK